jgi:selenide, water dikinase
LRRLPSFSDPNLLVGAATADDAGIYRLDANRALVQTVDFFTPIVDDPVAYGQIAATNALSDVYAMGGRPLTALNIMGIPTDLVPPAVINAILRGGAAKVKEARCALVGGHTIRNPEPIYGLSVTGLVSPKKFISNAAAAPGDLLVLTKPLGTGIATTGIKRGLSSPALEKLAIRIMTQLNAAGADLAELGLVRAGVDVTGFGLLGHLGSMCRASGVGAQIDSTKLPVLSAEIFTLIEKECIPGGSRDNLAFANQIVEWDGVPNSGRVVAADAQTSGGLLLCVSKKNLDSVLRLLKKHRTSCAVVIGQIVASRNARIQVSAAF